MLNKRSLMGLLSTSLVMVSLPAWCKPWAKAVNETALVMIYTHPDGTEYWLEHIIPDEGHFTLKDRLESGKKLLTMKARIKFLRKEIEEGRIKTVEKGPGTRQFIWNTGGDKFEGVYISKEDYDNCFDPTSVKVYSTRNSKEERNYDLIPGPGWIRV